MFMLLEHAIFTCFTTRILSVSVEERALITREASLVASSPGRTMVQLKGKNGRVLQTDAGSPDYQPTAEPSVRDGGAQHPPVTISRITMAPLGVRSSPSWRSPAGICPGQSGGL